MSIGATVLFWLVSFLLSWLILDGLTYIRTRNSVLYEIAARLQVEVLLVLLVLDLELS